MNDRAPRIIFIVSAAFLLIAFFPHAFSQPTNSESSEALASFVREYVTKEGTLVAAQTRYISASVHLSGGAEPEVLIYLIGPNWCGTGGCTMLVLAPAGASYKIVTETSVTRLPIRVLSAKTNGWHDLAVWVQGGGILVGYEARLCFDGSSYPENPSAPPALPIKKKMPGHEAISANAKENAIPVASDSSR